MQGSTDCIAHHSVAQRAVQMRTKSANKPSLEFGEYIMVQTLQPRLFTNDELNYILKSLDSTTFNDFSMTRGKPLLAIVYFFF